VHPVGPLQVIDNLGRAESEKAELDHAGDEREAILLVRRIGTLRLYAAVAARAVVARDLDVKDQGLGGREIGDGPSADLERLSEASSAVRTLIEGEFQRRSIRHGALTRTARVARLSSGGVGVVSDRATIEDAARGNATRLGSSIGGSEHWGAGLVTSEFLQEPSVLLPQLTILLLEPLRPLELLSDPFLLGRIDRNGLVVLAQGEENGRGPREQSPLGKRGCAPTLKYFRCCRRVD